MKEAVKYSLAAAKKVEGCVKCLALAGPRAHMLHQVLSDERLGQLADKCPHAKHLLRTWSKEYYGPQRTSTADKGGICRSRSKDYHDMPIK